MAVILSIVFKKDSDVTEFESDLGKMKKHDSDLMPLNTGESSQQSKHIATARRVTRDFLE